jgi:RimJ/RimL family protein N-acetyltransferase
VLEKAGFRPMGMSHRYRFAKGRWWDMAQFALERAAWEAMDEEDQG